MKADTRTEMEIMKLIRRYVDAHAKRDPREIMSLIASDSRSYPKRRKASGG